MKDYSKFSAIIIGAGVSTGSAITRKFAEMGYRVCPVRRERNFSELEELANGIKEAGYQATPFGAYKQSGYSREKGVDALKSYLQVKNVGISLD